MAKTAKTTLTMSDFSICSNKELKAEPKKYKMNIDGSKDVITVRKESKEMNKYDSFDIAEQLLKKMNDEDEIELTERFDIDFIFDMVKKGILVVNLKEIKDWVQRMGDVIAVKLKSRLILSLINGDACMPEVQTIIGKDGETGNLVIYINDGMQRLTTIVSFVNDEFKLVGTGTILDGYYFSELPKEVKKIFLKRLVRFHIIHEVLIPYRVAYFKTLNTTSTKMTMGELVNTKFSSMAVTRAAHDQVEDADVQKVFLPVGVKKEKRLSGESETLFAVATHYIYTKDISIKKISGKCDMISKFMSLDEVKDYDPEIRKLMKMVPEVCAKMNEYFGPSFTKRIARGVTYTAQNPHFPEGYEPYARKKAVCSTHTSIMYFITSLLFDDFDSMPSDAIKEITMNIDEIFGSDSFHRNYNTSVNSKKIINRMSYVVNEAVNPVLAKYGFDVFETRFEA